MMMKPKIPQSCNRQSFSLAQIRKEKLSNKQSPIIKGALPLPLNAICATPAKIRININGSRK